MPALDRRETEEGVIAIPKEELQRQRWFQIISDWYSMVLQRVIPEHLSQAKSDIKAFPI